MTLRGLFGLGVPFFFGRTIGLIADRAPSEEVWTSAGCLVAVSATTAFAQFWMRWLYISSSRRFEERLRNEVFEHLTRLSYSWFNRARTGDLMSRLTADVEAVRMGVGPGVMHLYQTSTMAIAAFSIMLIVSWQLTLFAVLPLSLIFLNIRAIMPAMHRASTRVQDQLAAVSATAQESFSGARVVKAFAREGHEIERFQREASHYIDASMNMTMVRGRMHAVTEWMAGLVTVALIYFGGQRVMSGALELGSFVSFFGYFMMLIWPMIAIGWTMALFERAKAALIRLESVLDTEPEIQSGHLRDFAANGDWKVRNLSFRHDESDQDALCDISFDLPAGKSLAVVGPTGCGKSTLAQLFARLFEPPPGTFYYDGHDLRDLALGELRSRVAMVPQETFLFSDTIQANIAYGVDNHETSDVEAAVHAAAEAAQVKEAIEGFPRGFDEVIGERGVTLSGGQKQRVAIARALMSKAPTLILDDCLSAVDTGTEERILDHLRQAMTQRSSVIIAHRLSSVRHCDRILVLIDGAIAEEGTHEELMSLNQWYADTFRQQQLKSELDAA